MDKETVLKRLLQEHGGILKTADAVGAGITKQELQCYVKASRLEKIAHGLYLSEDGWNDEMYLLQVQYPKIVFSHETALYLHDLTEMEPVPLRVTVPANYNTPSLQQKGVQLHFVKNTWYQVGVTQMQSMCGNSINVYNMERTICDIIRRRNHMDASVFHYALREYVKRPEKSYVRLMDYAKTMRMEKTIYQVMGVLL